MDTNKQPDTNGTNGREEASSRSFSSSSQAQGEEVRIHAALYHDAEIIEQSLRAIQHAMRYSIEADKRLIPLTPPQIQALTVLSQSTHKPGLTLKELSERMGLAHSTVSGIVDRLELQGLVQRVVDKDDRRARRIEVTERVTQYLQQDLAVRRLRPLLEALQQASEAERSAIMEGLASLQRLLASAHGRSEEK